MLIFHGKFIVYRCLGFPRGEYSYLFAGIVALAIGYLLFMKRYYHLHEEYLAGRG